MDKDELILDKACDLASKTKTWADFSNALFDPFDGEIVRAYPSMEERKQFAQSPVYRELRSMVQAKMRESGLVAGATPKKSGKFVVRLPVSLHAALEREAESEGTSLNQLVVTKLAVQLSNLASDPLSKMIQAFGEIRAGYSVDRVIADPELDRKYLRRCRELGLTGTDYDLNWQLMSARKRSELSELPETKKYTLRGTDEFEFASELAVKFLQNKKNVSLDQIICDPDLAMEFDQYAAKIAPGFAPLEYRWVALGLRKAGRFRSREQEIDTDLPWENIGTADVLQVGEVPESSGLYMFSTQQGPIFVGQTENLRRRVNKHLEISSGGLPEWLWDTRKQPLKIEVASVPHAPKVLRQRMELALVRKWQPPLNFRRVA